MDLICKMKNIYKVLYDYDKEFSQMNGVTLNEAVIIYSLINRKYCSASDLSESMGLSNSRASRVLFNLEKKEYIIREMGKEDKRQMLFSLTKSGKHKLEEIQSRENEYNEFITSFTSLAKHLLK